MAECMITSLSWLPAPPDDIRSQIKSAADGAALQRVAGFCLNANQLSTLARTLQQRQADGMNLSPLSPFKLGIVGNATTELFTPALQATALRHGIHLEIVEAPFDTMAQEALNPASQINQAGCDAVFFALDARGFPTLDAEDVYSHLMQLRAGLKDTSCIFQTLIPQAESLFGGFERQATESDRSQIDAINRKLIDHAANSDDVVFDVTLLAETVGLSQWHDPTGWHLSKLPFSQTLVPLYADHLARLIAAMRGKSRKVLVLDLDNTLWGGVIGDDGLEGITLGEGNPLGEAYLDIQRTALALRDRGIVLAVCSKNNDDVARQPFQNHPDMLLKEEHISIFQANWTDKASNLQAIAEHLSLGLDSLVFLDDNPAERARVRQMLPQIGVPELPDDPALFTRALMAAGYFETIRFSEEDKKRASYYHKNAERLTLKNKLGSFEDYLKSLEMVLSVSPFDAMGRARITQLINKSNQFNLTTIRYTEAEVTAAEEDPDVFTLQGRLEDKFGDNGMIDVVVCRKTADDTWDIDTWLMSCRVLERRVEEATLAEIARHALAQGVTKLTGRWISTGRNDLVKDHYTKLGFQQTSEDDHATYWALDLKSYNAPELPIEIKRNGFDKTVKRAA